MHGSCNGLICLSNEWTDTIYLWNPSLGKLKTLPNSPDIESRIIYSDLDSYSICLAFGFHPKVNAYRVVKIWCLVYKIIKPYKYQLLIDVYSLSTDSWRRIDVAPSCYLFNQNPAIVNGVAYWVAIKETWEGSCYLLLVRFEMGDEVFEEVMLLDGVKNCCPKIAILGERESLYLFIFYHLDKCWDIWTMECGKTSCWTKRFTGNFHDTPAKLLGLRKRGELLLQNHEGHMLSCNIET
ncbi:F-box/kelch-repeat protein At3g23880-like [Cornus florida]|uniref:F-box/kelch-repeat protein At3g23880-like n=1 Tax=Cornus florida TaxID=4283 RepID=UPI00289FF604|nr:F-box/kelch-repeat protein At3g23880-like [Cornus florida]